MDFTLTNEQQMLLDTSRRFFAKDYDFAAREKIRHSNRGFSDAAWQGMSDLGLLALAVPEADGGMGGSAIDMMLVMTALGEALVLEPYLASALLATTLIATTANATQREELLTPMMTGELIAVPAHDEAGSRFDWRRIATRAAQTDNGFLLNGKKSLVVHAASAHLLLVTARLRDQSLALFGVPRKSAGVRLTTYRTVDGIVASEVVLDNVLLPTDARLDGGMPIEDALRNMRDIGLAAVCAEAVGILDKLLEATVTHARERKQFGQPIGKFQALQHRMADMVLHIEQARSMSTLAAVRCNEADLAVRHAALSAAKVVVGQACRFVGQQAVQLHGGMGVTDELIVSHYFKRLMAIELQFGSTDQHLEAYAAQLVAA
jgi:alkylation response protein AidB-like acyl-CoA dehydrogenase